MGKRVLSKVLLMWFTTKDKKCSGWWYRFRRLRVHLKYSPKDSVYKPRSFVGRLYWPICMTPHAFQLNLFFGIFPHLFSSFLSYLEPRLSHLQAIIFHNIFPHKGNEQWATVSSRIPEYICPGLRKQEDTVRY